MSDQTVFGDGPDLDFEIDDDKVTAEEHLPRAGTSRTSTGGQRKTTRRSKRLETLQKALSAEMFTAGTMISFALNTTGYYICQESDTTTQAIVDLAATRPEWIKALEKVSDISPGLLIGKTTLGIGVAIAVDREKIKPDKTIAKLLGVTAAYDAVHDEEATTNAGNGYQPPPHGAFVPLG
jgi:hypothetical protein